MRPKSFNSLSRDAELLDLTANVGFAVQRLVTGDFLRLHHDLTPILDEVCPEKYALEFDEQGGKFHVANSKGLRETYPACWQQMSGVALRSVLEQHKACPSLRDPIVAFAERVTLHYKEGFTPGFMLVAELGGQAAAHLRAERAQLYDAWGIPHTRTDIETFIPTIPMAFIAQTTKEGDRHTLLARIEPPGVYLEPAGYMNGARRLMTHSRRRSCK